MKIYREEIFGPVLSIVRVPTYEEALRRLRSLLNKDHFIDYCAQGKRSYWIASTYEDDPHAEESRVLRRLSEQFELCAWGLNQVRREWEMTVKTG